MPRRYHEALGVSASSLRRTGAFNGFVDLDSEFYVDPRLLERTRVPEFKGAADRFEKHFRDALRLLKHSRAEGDRFWRGAVERLRFKEVTHTGLGYGKTSTRGSAVGGRLATELARSAKDLLRAGIDDPDIFELLGMFQEGFGPDRVSDIAVRIILPEVLAYTARVATRLGAPTRPVDIDGAAGVVPFDGAPDRWFLLLPESILTKLPVAWGFEDIASVCAHNAALRQHVNDRLGPAWRRVLAEYGKEHRRRFLLENPDIFGEIIREYRRTAPEAYDFDHDPAMELAWHQVGRAVADANPLPLALPAAGATADAAAERDAITGIVDRICQQFRHLVEHCGVWEVLWDTNDKPRIERVAQRLFLTVAESYCQASNLDLTPEANAGSGPVDFKMSRGYGARVLVELKRSGNTQLTHGYAKQLERYKAAEQTTAAFFVIVDFADRNADEIAAIVRRARRAARQGKPYSRVVLVDAAPKASASRF
jgi:hypothetical protein